MWACFFSAESVDLYQPGAPPQDSGLHDGQALKARLNALVNRAFSADKHTSGFPGALPQAVMNTAPLALNRHFLVIRHSRSHFFQHRPQISKFFLNKVRRGNRARDLQPNLFAELLTQPRDCGAKRANTRT